MGKSKDIPNAGGNKKEKTVETDNLRILGHLLEWEGVIIQISNISLITTSNMSTARFPFWTLAALIIGFALLQYSWIIGLLLLAVAGVVMYLWYSDVQRTQNHKYLNILLNSGYTYSILFKDNSFLSEVLKVFANIFEEGTGPQTNYYIDLDNCEIKDSNVVRNSTVY